MKLMNRQTTCHKNAMPHGIGLAALITLALGLAATPVHAQVASVQVRDEPLHRLKLDTGKYRVYDVLVDQPDAMLFHEHKADSATIFLSGSEITNEAASGQKADFVVGRGLVSFASAAPEKSYVHRIRLRAGAPFHNVTIEFLQPQTTTSARGDPGSVDSALISLRESSRGKAYRLNLEPEQSASMPSDASDIFVVCLSDGSLAQASRSRPGASLNCTLGGFHLLEKPDGVSLRNEGTGRVELAVIAVH